MSEVARVLYVVEMIESESGWGQKSDGYLGFLTEAKAKAYVADATKDYKGSAPAYYVRYDLVGYKSANEALMQKAIMSKDGRVYFDKMRELA